MRCRATMLSALALLCIASAVARLQGMADTVADDRKEALARLQKVTHAFHAYADDLHRRLPPAALASKEGKPLLSWRVLLLPYLGEQDLFRQFHLDEPWDSTHNKKLLARMPRVFAPVRMKSIPAGETLFQVFTGPRTPFEGVRACRFPADFPDGTSNTFLVAEAAIPVPWSKPADLPYDPKKPLPKLGAMFEGAFLCSLADGSVNMAKRNAPERTLRLLIVRDDRVGFDFNDVFIVPERH